MPLVRLSLAAPLVRELEQRRIDSAAALYEFSCQPSDFTDRELFVPAPKMYAIVEKLAQVSGDPHFGVHVGQQLDPFSWSPMTAAARQSSTVGEFLLRFMEDAGRDENSVTFILKTIGNRSTFHERRITDGGVFPRHNDGFTIAYLLNLIRRAVGNRWEGSNVVAHVSDPAAIPTGYLGIRVAATDTLGASVSFPSGWLLARPARESVLQAPVSVTMETAPAASIVDAFRQAMLPHIHEFDLDAGRVADLCGLSKRTLARRLQQRGTSVQREISDLRRSCAERELRHSDKPVAAIAAEVGYSDAAVFSRAFRRWTGLSPRQFRQTSKTQSVGQGQTSRR